MQLREAASLAGARRRRVNDVHSQLNHTTVQAVVRPQSVAELQAAVGDAAASGTPVSVCGGRHAMGGQQFGRRTILVDTTGLNRVVELDDERGLVTVEAGIDWPRLVNHLLWAAGSRPDAWGIIQKQTGADRMTIGGALSANIHGRGLRLAPFVADVEAFDLVDADGRLVRCSRTANAPLFALAIGGYGLFGPIARATLRLARRRKLERCVTIARVDDLPDLFDQRVHDGFVFGDFQFAIDPQSSEFLRAGVLSCYRPVELTTPIRDGQFVLSEADWRRLMHLAHTDKSRAFAEYARYYMATDGQIYWSDTHQLADYLESYHADVDRQTGASVKGTEMISELYVPRERLSAFMDAVRGDARRHAFEIVYGTIRAIERDAETMLAWARERWACVVVNLHVDHTRQGIAKAAADFRRLIDRAAEQGGSYYLTYHRWATADQVAACHPHMHEFLREKRRHDPHELFQSEWYRHHARLMEMTP